MAETGNAVLRRDCNFHTTQWTAVMLAKEREGTAAREALGTLCSTYWYPLYAYVRRRGFSPHDAEDLTQGFFCLFLDGNKLANVSPAVGKFRSFLLACLKHFLASQWERAHAQKRGGSHGHVSLSQSEAETRFSVEPKDQTTPETLFEKNWAFALLEHTLNTLEKEYQDKSKGDLFRDLRGFLPGCIESKSRAELAANRGISVGAVDVAVHRLRQRFGALLRSQVAQTVSSESEVDEEIRYLMTVLGT